MKRFLIWLGLAAALSVQSAIPVPDIGNGRIRVLANNLQNYYFNYAESSRPSYHDEAGLAEKTHRIMDMMLTADADIYAFCEVEAKPVVLQQLVDSLNLYVGTDRYAAVSDNINVATDSYDNAIKSGFIYRKDKVVPYGDCSAATNVTYYKNTMRIQNWEELLTGERFVTSMNHFKAMSDAASVEKRVDNANWLMSGLSSTRKVKDPDILILGDLNAQMDEEAIAIIQYAGFVEQLLRFHPESYTYCYHGEEEIIDHVFANSTMASQITGAAVWHINTTCEYSSNYYTRFSDHDPYLVALNLGGELPDGQGFDPVTGNPSPLTRKIFHNGILLIERAGKRYTLTGLTLSPE